MLMRFALKRSQAVAWGVIVMLGASAPAAWAIGGVGDIVFDPSNYAQAVAQVQAWEQQYAQMAQSLTKAEATLTQVKSQVAAVTGNRGFGDLFDNPLLKTIVPSDLATTLAGLNTTGQLSGPAAALRSQTAIYDCGDLGAGAAKLACQAWLGQNAQAQVIEQDTMARLIERTTQIDALRSEIGVTQDPKAIAELTARLAAEQAQVGNDQNKIAMTNAMLAASQAAAAQAQMEHVAALMAAGKPSVLDGFRFTGLGYQPAAQTADPAQ